MVMAGKKNFLHSRICFVVIQTGDIRMGCNFWEKRKYQIGYYMLIALWETASILIPIGIYYSKTQGEFSYLIKSHLLIYTFLIVVLTIVLVVGSSAAIIRKKLFYDMLSVVFTYILIITSIIMSYSAIYQVLFDAPILQSIYGAIKVFATIGIPKVFGHRQFLYFCHKPSSSCLAYLKKNELTVLLSVGSEAILSHIIGVMYFSIIILGYQEKKL